MNSCALASRAACFDLGLRRVRLAEAQILLDRAVEQVGVLVHDRDLAAQRLGIERAQIAPADPHRAAIAGRTGAAAAAATDDLPEPLGPTMPTRSPAATANDSPSCAARRPPG